MKEKTAEKPVTKPLFKRRVRDRSIKERPKDALQLLTAIDDNKLDGRSSASKRITALRGAIAAAPVQAAIGVVRDALALDLTVAQVIVGEISRPTFEVLQGGKLNPLLKTWQDLERRLLYVATVLSNLEKGQADQGKAAHAPNKGGPVDISALVLESQADEE
jgi:hypothetical protein